MTSRDDVVARAQAERRRYRRVPVDIPGRIFLPDEQTEAACKVVDLSPGGARVLCDMNMPAETRIVIYIDGFGRFEGQVARGEEGGFGLRFQCSAAKRERVAEQLIVYLNKSVADESILRRHERQSSKGMASFTRASGEIVNCEVLDLSLSGVSLKTDHRAAIGEFVLIGHMAGRVARHHESGIAIEFVGAPPEKMQPERAIQPRLIAVR